MRAFLTAIAVCAVAAIAGAAGVHQPLTGTLIGSDRTISVTRGTGSEVLCGAGGTPQGFNGSFGSATGTSLGGGITLTALVDCNGGADAVSVVRITGFGANPGVGWFFGGPCIATSGGAYSGTFRYPPYTAVNFAYGGGTATWQYLTLAGAIQNVNVTCQLAIAQ